VAVINGELTLRILTEISSYPHEFLDLRDLRVLIAILPDESRYV
jgi:hypothetical protein